MAWLNSLHLLIGPLLAVPLLGYALALTPPPAGDFLAANFRSLDRNQDGKVDLQEYLAPWGQEKPGPERWFRELDRDRDGFLSLEEYLGVEEKWSEGTRSAGP